VIGVLPDSPGRRERESGRGWEYTRRDEESALAFVARIDTIADEPDDGITVPPKTFWAAVAATNRSPAIAGSPRSGRMRVEPGRPDHGRHGTEHRSRDLAPVVSSSPVDGP
jgi:hypothetical protein